MNTLNSKSNPEDEICSFIRSLKNDRLDYLVANPPLGNDLLLHAKTCAACAAKIAGAIREATEAGVHYDVD